MSMALRAAKRGRDIDREARQRMRYIHIHRRGLDGLPLDHGGFTLVISRRHADGRLVIAMAKCRDDKRFDKRHGRIVAASNLASNRYRVVRLDELGYLIEQLGGDPRALSI